MCCTVPHTKYRRHIDNLLFDFMLRLFKFLCPLCDYTMSPCLFARVPNRHEGSEIMNIAQPFNNSTCIFLRSSPNQYEWVFHSGLSSTDCDTFSAQGQNDEEGLTGWFRDSPIKATLMVLVIWSPRHEGTLTLTNIVGSCSLVI